MNEIEEKIKKDKTTHKLQKEKARLYGEIQHAKALYTSGIEQDMSMETCKEYHQFLENANKAYYEFCEKNKV